MTRPPAFRYLADPVFLGSALAYAANRCWLAPHWGDAVPFLTRHFSDVLLIPCALPLLVWLQRHAGLRLHDRPPTSGEILGTLALWSALFEGIFPSLLDRGVRDFYDVLAYAAGAVLAGFLWSWQSRPTRAAATVDQSRRRRVLAKPTKARPKRAVVGSGMTVGSA